jgi:hypothetical protein
MGGKFEARLLDIMIDRGDIRPCPRTGVEEYVIEVNDAIAAVRQMLNEFEATIYQP